MNTREQFHEKLVELFESDYVYYQAPDNLKMQYPCIRYSRDEIQSIQADNINYNNRNRYQVIVIDKKPDNPVIEKLLELPYSSFDRHYVYDNLNHDIVVVYY